MSDDVEAVQACLRDDAATLRDDNKECEIASNMDAAATLIGRLTEELAAANEARQKAEQGRDSVVRSTCELNNKYTADLQRLTDERDALRAEVERLREDAERYRWLRQPNPLSRAAHIAVLTRTGGWVASGDQCDAAIDAARKE